MARKAGNPISRRLAAHAKVNQYIKAQAADFGRIYDAARQEIDKRLRKEAVSAASRGTIPHSARLLAAMEQVYPRMEAAYREKFKTSIPYVAQSAHFMALQDLKLEGKEFDTDRVKLTLEDAYTHIAGMTTNMKKKDVAFLRETVAGVEREAAMTGMTPRQVTAELLTRLESRPEGFKFVDAGNRVWDSRAYSEMLARTTLLNTSRQEYLDTCAENGADVVAVTVSGHCCEKCAVWENRLLSISGATKGLPTVDEATADGLFHPNCTHSLTEVDDYTRKEEYNPDGTPKTGGEKEDEHDHASDTAPVHGVAAGNGNGAQYASAPEYKTITAAEFPRFTEEWEERIRQNATEEQLDALGYYTANAGGAMNRMLRGQTDPMIKVWGKEYLQDKVEKLSSMFDKIKTTEPLTVYRLLRTDAHLPNVGESYVEKGFSSCSLKPQSRFGNIVMEIRVPIGSRGGYINSASEAEEMEVLLDKNTKFAILGEKRISVNGEMKKCFVVEVKND